MVIQKHICRGANREILAPFKNTPTVLLYNYRKTYTNHFRAIWPLPVSTLSPFPASPRFRLSPFPACPRFQPLPVSGLSQFPALTWEAGWREGGQGIADRV